ncbi:Hsp70 protein that interacts with Zuo1p [Coemansia aciculifera]|uniref:Hsp70 protein that interacts with Zuo1p n=1 Tax=Coemansia aciculifera TaxID=417176 RepID=A0ACC1LZI7_9FUNG|nr:Hsp70 protein that interacts with Zuo1p [Coemansia aciculifera]KAJ2910663.1 Hsp70 protein that interacts with Zuo1p [Coemansia aciculifera]
MSTAAKTYIGLSLGNHNSVIAIINKDHRAEVIANEDGEHKTPTYIAFSGEEEYHGSQAKHQIVRNAQNTVAGFRDILGKAYSASMAEQHAGFAAIEASADGSAVFVIRAASESGEGAELRLTAHDATVRYLARLRTTAEDYLGRKIDGAVLAVPVWFTEAQRTSIGAACADAGLPLLQLVTEPAAAALQYGLGRGENAADSVALVVDVGGTGSDVSLVAATGGLVSVVSSAHTTAVSGEVIDDVLVRHFAAEFTRANGVDVMGNPRAVRKLRQAVEGTKRTLSSATTAPCAVESLAEGIDFNSSVNRTRFDILCARTYAPLLETIEKVVADAGYQLSQVDQVLLCGGAARVRRLQARVASLFPETTAVRDDAAEELDEVIAAGCAEQAALIAQGVADPAVAVADLKVDVLAHAVGLQIDADGLALVLRKDTPLPASRSVRVALPKGETRAYIAVSEGEPVPPKPESENDDEEAEEEEEVEEEEAGPTYRPTRLLAEMVLELDAADENTRVEVSFFVGTDRKLTVTAVEPVSGKTMTAVIPQ